MTRKSTQPQAQPTFDLGDSTVGPATAREVREHPTARKVVPANKADSAAAQGKVSSRKKKAAASSVALIVPAIRIDLHPSLGIELDEFRRDNAGIVAVCEEQFGRNLPSMSLPQVVEVDGRYLAIDHVELVAAARNRAVKQPGFKITVLRIEPRDQAQTVREQLSTSRVKSGWEQYCAIAPVFEGEMVAQQLRDLGLPETWKTTVSKVLKVGRLDPAILDAVKRFTIPVKEAGQIVDAWKDDAKRDQMLAALTKLRGDTNERIDAKSCFKEMLRVVRPAVVEPSWRDGGAGSQEYVCADGLVLATITVTEAGWTASGIAMGSAQWQAFGKNMPRPKRAA